MDRRALILFAALPVALIAVTALWLAWVTLPPSFALGATGPLPVENAEALAGDGEHLLVWERPRRCPGGAGVDACAVQVVAVDPATGVSRLLAGPDVGPPALVNASGDVLMGGGWVLVHGDDTIVDIASGNVSEGGWNASFIPHALAADVVVGALDGTLAVARAGGPPEPVGWNASGTAWRVHAVVGDVAIVENGSTILAVDLDGGDVQSLAVPPWEDRTLAARGDLVVVTGRDPALRLRVVDLQGRVREDVTLPEDDHPVTLTASDRFWVAAGRHFVFGSLADERVHQVDEAVDEAVAVKGFIAYRSGARVMVGEPGTLPSASLAYGGVASGALLIAGALAVASRRATGETGDTHRCLECGATLVRGLDFCPSCGRRAT